MKFLKPHNSETNNKKPVSSFERVFKNTVLKRIDIEIYLENPFVLLAKTLNKNLLSEYKHDKLVISNGNRHKTRIACIPLQEIKEYEFKQYAENEFEIVFVVQNIVYKVYAVI